MDDQLSNKGDDPHKGQAAGADNALINKMSIQKLNTDNAHLMSFNQAPDSAMARYGQVTLSGVEKLPAGVAHALVHNYNHPLETLETLGGAAAMAVALKTVLPETGVAGKVASAAIGLYFTYKAAEPIYGAYKLAGNARTMTQLDHASNMIGDAGGSFIVNSAIGAVGYKIGANLSDRVLTMQSMDGFADFKARAYDRLGDMTGRVTDTMGMTTPKEPTTSSPSGAKDSRVKVDGSERKTPSGVLKGEVDPNANMEVTVILKSKGSDLRMDRTLARIAQGRQAPLTDAQFEQTFGASKESLAAVSEFAQDYGIKVAESDLKSGRVVLSGHAGGFSSAFQTRLAQYETPSGHLFRGREGSLTVPRSLADHITGVLGTDDRPQLQVRSVMRFLDHEVPADVPPSGTAEPNGKKFQGYMPDEVADAYNFPKDHMGKGQAVGVIELGGGLDLADNAKYYEARGLAKPDINVIELGKAKNRVGSDSRADGEVALDSQVIGVIAPEAKQNLIFTENTDKGFLDAVTRATFAKEGEVQNSVISISWGAPEELWSQNGMEGLNQAFKKAALKGISVFAASGDDGALDGSRSGSWQVDYPASDPAVTGTGGTRLTLKDGKVVSEVAWNNHQPNNAGGGGVSQSFQAQDFQKNANVPMHAKTGEAG
ncbi:MAG: S53 family peptidase, partial [Candidatus Obscuribacterales bacterium]|nr:S53 family peptidase [Candidatus Obscuribacterales bacterium]